ncbi:MAG TPA: AI-2E family transporter [Rubrobacteraceae bacterium]|nr:AI-2E family transporter [Rubrobacteraceae bacterium]
MRRGSLRPGGEHERVKGFVDSPLTERGLRRILLQILLALFGLLLVWRFLAEVATVTLLIATGLLVAVALSGPVEVLRRHKIPRAVSAALILAGVALTLLLGGWLLLPVLQNELAALADALPAAYSYVQEKVQELAGALGLNINLGLSSLSPADLGRRLLGGALGLFSTLASSLAGVLIVTFLSFYLAAMPDPIVEWVLKLFPPDRRPQAEEMLSKMRAKLLDWLKGRLLSMAVVGALSIASLYVIGIPGAFSLGIFAGLVSFVPYVGPIVSVVPPALIALSGNPADVIWVLLAYAGIQVVESYLITPVVMEEVASLHPAVVVAAVATLGTAFGVLGAILALPIALVVGVLVEELWFKRWRQRDEPA